MLPKEKLKRFHLSPAYTIMLVPHSEESVRKFQMPVSFVKAAIIISLCCILAASYGVVNYLTMKKNMTELHTLRSVNQSQKAALQSLEEETAKLKTKMDEVNGLESSIKEMLNGTNLSSRSESSSTRRQAINSPDQSTEKNGLDKLLAIFSAPSPEAQAAQWNNQFGEIAEQADSLIAEMDISTEELASLKEQLAERISYLRAKPTGWPVQGRITSKFGYRPSPFGGRRTEYHDGLDIAAPYGTPVLAPCDGKVVFAGRTAVLGKTVTIQSDHGFQTVFGHNSKVNVKVGDAVSRGDCISHVGSTGRSTGAHVHYEVWVSGKRTDPIDYLN